MSKRLLLTGVFLAGLLGVAEAQPASTRETGTRNVEVDPIRCWWRTSAGAVRLGEHFDLTMTCAVLESNAVSVVVDESRLGNAVVQLAPFEVVSGSHPADLHTPMRRFFQYEYRLRLIDPDVVGTDVRIPDMALHYRVNSRVGGSTAIQGRDLQYNLPPAVVRITSLVPGDATDIRDASGTSFTSIDALAFRAGIFNIAGTALIAFGGLMVLLVLVRLARGARKRTPADQRELSAGTLIGIATRELAAVRKARGADGWTDELASRALAATRIAAAGALGRTIAQRSTALVTQAGEGRLMTRGPRRGTQRILSAPTTAREVSRQLELLDEADARRPTLEVLRDSLLAFTAVQYAREPVRDEAVLDDALESAIRAAASVRAQHIFPRSLFRNWAAGASTAESRA